MVVHMHMPAITIELAVFSVLSALMIIFALAIGWLVISYARLQNQGEVKGRLVIPLVASLRGI
jgi:hypothetical protein